AEDAVHITNSLSENITTMRLSLVPGLLENVAYNRSYGTRDGALFEVGRTYHRAADGIREHRRAAMVLYGHVGEFWGDAKRPFDFFDLKGRVDQTAAKFHVALTYGASDQPWLRRNRSADARCGDRRVASLGLVAAGKGDALAAEIDIEALLALSKPEW